MVFPIELVLPIDGRDAGEVLGEGDAPPRKEEGVVMGNVPAMLAALRRPAGGGGVVPVPGPEPVLEVSVASGDPEVTLDIQLQRRITG